VNSNEDVVREVSNDTKLPKDLVRLVLSSLDDVAKDHILNEGEFKLLNLMTIKTRFIPERNARNPKTGDIERYPAVNALTAKFSTGLRRSFKSTPIHNLRIGDSIDQQE
jgi:nucleoid DNA-binding protein